MHHQKKQGSSPKAAKPIQVTDTQGRNLKVDHRHIRATSYHGHDPLTKHPVHSMQTFDMGAQIGLGTKQSIGVGFAIAATVADLNVFAIQWLQSKGCRVLGKDGKDLCTT